MKPSRRRASASLVSRHTTLKVLGSCSASTSAAACNASNALKVWSLRRRRAARRTGSDGCTSCQLRARASSGRRRLSGRTASSPAQAWLSRKRIPPACPTRPRARPLGAPDQPLRWRPARQGEGRQRSCPRTSSAGCTFFQHCVEASRTVTLRQAGRWPFQCNEGLASTSAHQP